MKNVKIVVKNSRNLVFEVFRGVPCLPTGLKSLYFLIKKGCHMIFGKRRVLYSSSIKSGLTRITTIVDKCFWNLVISATAKVVGSFWRSVDGNSGSFGSFCSKSFGIFCLLGFENC